MAADPQDLISYLSQYLLSRNRDYHVTFPHDLNRKTSVTMKNLKLKSAAPSPRPPQQSPVEPTESMIKQLHWSVHSALRERDPVLSIARDSQGTWESLQLLRTWQDGDGSEAKIESHRSALTVITACLQQGRWAAQHTPFFQPMCPALTGVEQHSKAHSSNLQGLFWSQKGGKWWDRSKSLFTYFLQLPSLICFASLYFLKQFINKKQDNHLFRQRLIGA